MTGPLTALVVVAGALPPCSLSAWESGSRSPVWAAWPWQTRHAACRSERGGRHPPRPDVRRHLVPALTPCRRSGELNGRRGAGHGPSSSRISAPPERRTRVTSAAI